MRIVSCLVVGLSVISGLCARTADLKIYPPEVRVHIGSEGQTILLIATDDDGVSREISANEAAFTVADNSTASLASARVVKGNKQGDTELRVSFDGVSAGVPLHVLPARPHELSFINDIVPIFTRADCANSNCHGSVRGQKGFKLSLFGSDPELDYDAITKNGDGHRIDRNNPAASLVLKKPTFQVPHGGGQRFKTGSPEYNAMLEWLEKGAPFGAADQARLKTLTVYPREWRMIGLGSAVNLIAVGEYNDGSVRDLTHVVRFSSNISAIASVKPGGQITAESVGETAIMARTLGLAAAVPMLVVKDRPIKNYPDLSGKQLH